MPRVHAGRVCKNEIFNASVKTHRSFRTTRLSDVDVVQPEAPAGVRAVPSGDIGISLAGCGAAYTETECFRNRTGSRICKKFPIKRQKVKSGERTVSRETLLTINIGATE